MPFCTILNIKIYYFRVLKRGARIVLLTSHNLKERLLEEVSKVCGLRAIEHNSRVEESHRSVEPNEDGSDEMSQPNTYTATDTSKHIDSSSTVNVTFQWQLKRSHYLKLGETNSYALSFLKE